MKQQGKEWSSDRWFLVEVFSAELKKSVKYLTYTTNMSLALKIVKKWCHEKLEGLYQVESASAYAESSDIPYTFEEVHIPSDFSFPITYPDRRQRK